MPRSRLSKDLCSELRNVSSPVVKAKGAILFRSGQPVTGAFLIRRGEVRLSLDNSALYPARTLGAGHVLGLPASFSGEPYSLTAKAEKDCRLDFIPRARLLELLLRKPNVGFQIVRMLSEEISQMRKTAMHNKRGASKTGRN